MQVRDYIHVVDLADGHIAALRKLDAAGIGNTQLSLASGITWQRGIEPLTFSSKVHHTLVGEGNEAFLIRV